MAYKFTVQDTEWGLIYRQDVGIRCQLFCPTLYILHDTVHILITRISITFFQYSTFIACGKVSKDLQMTTIVLQLAVILPSLLLKDSIMLVNSTVAFKYFYRL